MNPPNDGTVWIGPNEWRIARTGDGEIVLKQNSVCHPDFTDGMDIREFCEWVNSYYGAISTGADTQLEARTAEPKNAGCTEAGPSPSGCGCPSVACPVHGLPPGSASGGW